MNEIQGGLNRPMNSDEFKRLWMSHGGEIREHTEAAEALRNRIANGKRTIEGIRAGTLKEYTVDQIPEAEALLAQLEQELREHDWWVTISLAMAMAHSVPALYREAAAEEGWTPPPGSILRLVMPGMLNIAVELK